MKKLLLITLLLFVSSNIQAVECVFSWDASVSDDVTHYNLYNGDDILVGNIKELTTTIICEPGIFSLTAVNDFDLESIKSTSITVKKPDIPLGFDVRIK